MKLVFELLEKHIGYMWLATHSGLITIILKSENLCYRDYKALWCMTTGGLIFSLKMYDAIIQRGFDYHQQLSPYAQKPSRGRAAKRPGYNLLSRLRNYRVDATRFITQIQVPFTNNLAEQDLRMMKVKQKISGGFRSEQGASQFLRIRSFISTLRKQSQNILDGITQAVTDNVLIPAG